MLGDAARRSSPARLPLRQPSSTTTRGASCAPSRGSVSSSSGRSVRRSMTSASMPVGRERVGGRERLRQRAAVGDERDVAAWAPDRRAIDVDRADRGIELALDVVELHVLEDDDRIGIARARPRASRARRRASPARPRAGPARARTSSRGCASAARRAAGRRRSPCGSRAAPRTARPTCAGSSRRCSRSDRARAG